MDVWKPSRIDKGQCLHWQVGPLRLWVQRTDVEWQLAFERKPEEEDGLAAGVPSEITAELDWKRWAAGEESNVVQIVPVMPDRPLIVRPESPLKIPEGNHALFYVTVPVWVRVTVGEAQQVSLCEEPTAILSHSWFGEPIAGELCYSLRTTARRTLETLGNRPNRAICPVHIKNDATGQLDFQRLCVRVSHLNCYAGKEHLWTSEVDVAYKGEEQLAQIDYSEGPPAGDEVGDLLSEARTPLAEGFIQKTFGGLKAFTIF